MTNTTTKKITKKEQFTSISAILSVALENELISDEQFETLDNFITHEIELLEKKASADRKPTAKQTENDSLREAILDCMEESKGYTISDMIKNFPCCAGLSQSKVSAVMRPILTVNAKGEVNPDGIVERYEEKGKAYFKLA